MRIAIIADTHGNLLALEAVLADLRSAAADALVNLGDLVSGGFDPAGSAAAQMGLGCATVAGNHERQVLDNGPGRTDIFARSLLSAAQLEWIGGLPRSLLLDGGAVFACHGSPAGGDLEYLLDDVSSGRSVLDRETSIRPRLIGIGAATLVLCGHSHTARVAVVDGVTILNPGSVGLPAYADDGETPHVMEAGSPHARYAVATRRGGVWDVELCAVGYDWEAASAQAEANGFALHARWAATGRA